MKTHRIGTAVVSALLLPLAFLTATSVPGSAAAPVSDPPDPDALTATPLRPIGRVDGFKSTSAALAKSSPGLLNRTDATLVPVMIKLDHDALASYQGGVEGLAATSPSATGRSLDLRSQPAREYRSYMAGNEQRLIKGLSDVAPRAEVRTRERVVYGGVSAVVPANKVPTILEIDGVVAVQRDRLSQPLTDSSPAFLNADPVYDKLGGNANAGAGIIYGNLDTGVWPEHPSFADNGTLAAPPGPARECNFGDNPVTPAPDPFVCQNKLIGGAAFTDSYDLVHGDDPYEGTARDSEGHGTHTASTSAGNALASAPVFGVDRGPLAGLAPGAWVMEYKVCGPQGCLDSDTAAAVGQAIVDGVDVINFSISGGTDPMTDPVELAFLDAYAARVFVAASAGNDGPGASTANHLSPWVTTVAASTQRREFATTLELIADNGDTFSADGASITDGAGPLPIVLSSAPPYSRPLCDAPAAAGTFTGKIVACQRGVNARVEKGFNVLQGGAAGMVLYNPTLADTETDNHWLPTVHLADGTEFVSFMGSHTGVIAEFAPGERRDGQGDVMAAFSSRGPAGNFIKPDVTAPGVQILAGHTPTPADPVNGPPGELFQAIAGTSMSSPHVAGAAILLRAAHPGWTPGQVKSALMTTSLTDVLKEDLTTPADPFDMGAGRIDIGRSDLAPLTLDESPEDYFALAGDPIRAVDLNLPSINAPVLPGRLVTHRTVTNVSGQSMAFDVSTTAPQGSSISVSARTFGLDSGESRDLTITITTDAPVGSQQFGEIVIRPKQGGQRMHLPVAWIHTQGRVSLDQACLDTTIARGETTECDVTATNNGFETQTVDLDTRVSTELQIESADGATIVSARHAQLHDVVLAGVQPGIPSMDPGSLAGYLPLADFGVTPLAIGDEEFINFNVPAYVFNGKTYTALGVNSNGYLVAGGGTSEDNNCCNLPPGPDPAPPNDVLAPFWTDLDGTGAEGLRIAVLTDGVDSWIVVEHQVNVFGTSSLRTFQVWIGINGTQDITFAYDPARLPADPAGQDFLVGAENELGQGDMVTVLPTTDQRITSTDPIPGDTASYSVTVRGQQQGTGTVTTEMSADGVPGVTIARTDILVRR